MLAHAGDVLLHKTVPIVNGNVSIWRTKYLRAEVSHRDAPGFKTRDVLGQQIF